MPRNSASNASHSGRSKFRTARALAPTSHPPNAHRPVTRSILTPIGLGLLIYGFGAFFQMLPGGGTYSLFWRRYPRRAVAVVSCPPLPRGVRERTLTTRSPPSHHPPDVSSLLLIYGFPISLLGFALSYAQLRPVPCFSQPAALKLREAQATDIQNQLRDDVTRFRYGDEQHLDEALSRIFRFGAQGGLPRRFCPVLAAVREEVRDGRYTLVLDFDTKEGMEEAEWTSRVDKITSFFGPGITAELKARAGGQEVALVVDGSGAGRGGEKQGDALPPLMPGLPARRNTEQ